MEKSRNLMTIRMAQEIGMGKLQTMQSALTLTAPAACFGDGVGGGETSLMRLTTAYAMW